MADDGPDTNNNTSAALATACGHCCQTNPRMQRCAGCHSQLYCGRNCQKAHWKKHKEVCSSAQESKAEDTSTEKSLSTTNATTGDDDEESESEGADSPSSQHNINYNNPPVAHTYAHIHTHTDSCAICSPALSARLHNPFSALENGTWLRCRSVRDTYILLLEAYRLRIRDKRDHLSRQPSTACSGAGFARFLRRAAHRVPDMLPAWWSDDHVRTCTSHVTRFFGSKASRRVPPTADEVAAHFADASMPLQLRLFGCAVCGEHPTANREGPQATRRTLAVYLEDMVRKERCAEGRCHCRRERLYGQARLAEAFGLLGGGEDGVGTAGGVVIVVEDLVVSMEDVTLGGEMGEDDGEETDEHEAEDGNGGSGDAMGH